MTKRKRFGKSDWLSLGLSQLKSDGPAGLTVEALCSAAVRTRGSFYHHFQDHGVFILEMMQAWKQQHTLDVADKTLGPAVKDRRQKLSHLANHLDHELERKVRQFAQSNSATHEVLQEVDKLRTDFVADLYRDRGLPDEEAMQIAQIEYAAFVGAQIVWPDMPAQDRMALDRKFAKLVSNEYDVDKNTKE